MKKSVKAKIGIYILAAILGTEAFGSTAVVYARESSGEETVVLKSGEADGAEDIYIVQKGDCLWNIARFVYGEGRYWREVYEYNREIIGEDPGFLLIGTKLRLPEIEESDREGMSGVETESGEETLNINNIEEAETITQIRSVEGGEELQDQKCVIYWKKKKAYYVKDMDAPEEAIYLGNILDGKTASDTSLSADGRYLYYGGTWKEQRLYRINLGELARDRKRIGELWEEVAGEVEWYKLVEDGSKLVYKDKEGTWFYFNGRETKLIAKNVISHQIKEDRINYLVEGQDEIFYTNAYLFEEEEKHDYDNYKADLLKEDKEIKKIYEISTGKNAIFYIKPGLLKGTCNLYYYEKGKESIVLAEGITEGNVVWDEELNIIFYMKADRTVCYSTDGTEQELGIAQGSLLLDWQGNQKENLLMLGYMTKEDYDQYKEEEREHEPQTYTANHRRLISYTLQDGKLIPKEQISNAYYQGCWYGDVYYYTECVEEYELELLGDEYRVELWAYQKGKKSKLSKEGPIDVVCVYEDGGALAWQWNWEDKGSGSKLLLYDVIEGFTSVTERANYATYINKDRMVYMVDEDLYLFTKGQGSRLIAEDIGNNYYLGQSAYINRYYSIL